MVKVLLWILLIFLVFTALFTVSEGTGWEESLWQAWQTATTVGYGNRPAETMAGRIFTMVAGTLGIAFVGVAISGAFDIREYFRERRRLGMAENKDSDGYVIIHWPGEEAFRVFMQQLMVVEEASGVCVIDDGLEELPAPIASEFENVHFVRGSALSRPTWEQAGIERARGVVVFPEDPQSQDSDGTTKTIVNLLAGHCGPRTRLMYILVNPQNRWMFDEEPAAEIWQNLEILALVQECQDPYSASVIARMLSNSEGANPETVCAGAAAGWTWEEFCDRLRCAARRLELRVSPLALIREGVAETCPEWDCRIEENDLLSVNAYPGFDWEKLQKALKKEIPQ
jgi:hypothetical protein